MGNLVNSQTILSSFDDQETLLKWLKKVESLSVDATLDTITPRINEDGTFDLVFKFKDNSEIVSSPHFDLPIKEIANTQDTFELNMSTPDMADFDNKIISKIFYHNNTLSIKIIGYITGPAEEEIWSLENLNIPSHIMKRLTRVDKKKGNEPEAFDFKDNNVYFSRGVYLYNDTRFLNNYIQAFNNTIKVYFSGIEFTNQLFIYIVDLPLE